MNNFFNGKLLNTISKAIKSYKPYNSFETTFEHTDKTIDFEDHIEVIYDNEHYTYYKSREFLHRMDGPAIISKYKTYEEDNVKEIIEKAWYLNNKPFPFHIPKIEDGLIYGKIDKRSICNIILTFDREYGTFLNKTYSAMKENKSNMQKEFQEHLLSMIKFYKEISFDKLNDELINSLGIIPIAKDSKVEAPKEIVKIMKVIEENVFDMVINKSIIYNEESKIISLI